MKLAIAVIHGMGSEEQHFSVELKHRIVEEYTDHERGRREEDLVFHELFWGDLIKGHREQFLKDVNYKKDLTYLNLRELFVDYVGATLAYRTSLYHTIQARIKDSLAKLCTHRRIDPDKTPLVVLAHSFGSVIMSDYIYDLQKQQENGPIDGMSNLEQFKTMAGFITFGTPLGIFSLQSDSDFDRPIDIVGSELPDVLKSHVRWDNYYDKDDILAYPLRGVNEAYHNLVNEDHEINVGGATTSWNPACHNGYWEDKDFYKPIAKYFADLRSVPGIWS